MQAPDGEAGGKLYAQLLQGRGWQEFKQAIGPPEPDHWDPPFARPPKQRTSDSEPAAPGAKPSEPPAFTRLLSGAELLALDLKPRFLVRGVMVRGANR